MREKLLYGTLAVCLALLGYAGYKALSSRNEVSLSKTEMLNTSFRIEAPPARGSGTVVHSGADGTFILTNHHVLAPALERLSGSDDHRPLDVTVRNWMFLPGRTNALPIATTATLVADDAAHDLALLKVDDPDFVTEPARFISPDDRVEMMERAFAAGGGIGNRPFVTEGLVSLPELEVEGRGDNDKTLISAPIIGGNSGGGAYVRRGGHFVMFGVPEAIEVAAGAGVPHMGIVIQMKTVRRFLASAGLSEFAAVVWPR